MRTSTAILVAIALASFIQADAYGQCQRGGGGSQRSSMPIQTGGITQSGVNPIFAMQRAAAQQAFMQQRFAAQQMQIQQIALRDQARQAKLAQRRSTAQQRRAAELARREEVRAANFEKLNAPDSQAILVALIGK